MSKPQAISIPSDDYEIDVEGVTYRPHEGEHVEIVRGMTIGQIKQLEAFKRLGTQLEAVKGEPDEHSRTVDLVTEALGHVTAMLASRVVVWNWTDNLGRPLPALDGTSAPFDALDDDELRYLINLVQYGAPAAVKNA